MTLPKPATEWQSQLPAPLSLSLRRNIEPGPNSCWVWKRSRSPDGYGWASFGNKTYQAHREGVMLSFDVLGHARPAGSKRAFVNPQTGRAIMVESSQVKPWREAVKAAAKHSGHTGGPLDCAVAVFVTFRFYRPKSLKKTVLYPCNRSTGDLSKLMRSTEDALVDAGLLRDDSLIVTARLHKRFTDAHEAEGAHVRVFDMTELPDLGVLAN